jgi:hypothetical protein
LSRQRSDQPQQNRLVLEQAPEASGFHVRDEQVIARGRAVLFRFRVIRRRGASPSDFGETLVERRSAKVTQIVQQ